MTNGHYLLIIAGIVSLFLFRECEHSSDMKLISQSMESQKAFFDKEMESYFAGKEISVSDSATVKQNLVASIEDVLDDKYSNLGDIGSIIKLETHTYIRDSIEYIHDTVYLSNNTEEFIHRDSITEHFIAKGSKVTHNELWYDISMTLGDSLVIDSLLVREKIDAILSYRKPDKSFKFLRKKEPIVTINSYSPHSNIGYINNLVVQEKKSNFGKALTSKPMMIVYGVMGVLVYQGVK